MKTTTISCDICKKTFSSRDNYVGGKIQIIYNMYLYDDGTNSVNKTSDLCEPCLDKIIKAVEKVKDTKNKKKRKG